MYTFVSTITGTPIADLIRFDLAGECKYIISSYLRCLKKGGGVNDETCRKLAKSYLTCRMDKYVLSPTSLLAVGWDMYLIWSLED